MREQLRVPFSNKAQPMLRLTRRDPVLALHPLEKARLQRTPQAIAEVPVPEFAVVFDPSSDHGVVSAGKSPQVIRRGSMDAPVIEKGQLWRRRINCLLRLATEQALAEQCILLFEMSDFRLHLSNQLLERSWVIEKVVGYGNHAADYTQSGVKT